MLAPILALTLVASGTFDSEQTIEKQTAYFKSQANGQYARVMALKTSAKNALEQACRNALTLPQRSIIKNTLAKKLNITLPVSVSFIDAEIAGYKQEKQQEWLTCTGVVIPAAHDINEAGLAVRAAWQIGSQKDKTNLRSLLQIALNHPTTMSDAVALVADQSPEEQRLSYLDKYLKVSELILDEAKASVAQTWFVNRRYKQVISLTQQCKSLDCKRLNLAAQTAFDNLPADDLSSYF
ncbi:hypothetical protein NH514_16100 [Pseudoalteromonas sp. ACER1]|jgi:hypothetical protein|uniref:hypothetical protein n=1 Tax=Pseudoalteromonas TaxID=53246 RepID=UPI0004535698|nr:MULTISPECIES: hypothetical protein [Pseudoalteromonas]EWH04359.1 hypothetical protein AT00_19865 [Pseudoalteromonas lipolytica SCSIO 04301]MCF2848818.1 hypothetical protein [Pseudoalteromonas sp. PAST1]MCF2918312.1 hypothetical protein [Pseudoalteromonas sp. Cn5-37]MCO7212243.1 hypothetical protein [Pseudoalteromonas sp. ACER1]MCO7251981.1 hypothetical protein [Pseudoalteromonas sp. Ps84H-4]|tara:strand:- start:3167 stop:3880 length:714 start_codon:yes stop_codon:yes gene_type:complete